MYLDNLKKGHEKNSTAFYHNSLFFLRKLIIFSEFFFNKNKKEVNVTAFQAPNFIKLC